MSELSQDIRVQGALKSATIVISSVGKKPRDVAKGTANGGDDRITLLVNEKLSCDDILVVMQMLGSDKSSITPKALGLAVQPEPTTTSELGAPGFLSHLYQCGQHVWAQGVVPGATVEISFDNKVQGSAIASEEGARIGLKNGLPKTGQISARQISPVGPGPAIYATPDSLPLTGNSLPPPTIHKPILLACQTAALVSDVFDGARVTLKRSSGSDEIAGFDLPALWFLLLKPLEEGESLTAKQDFPSCEIMGDASKPVIVDKATGLDKPFVPPLCAGSQRITVFNLVPGSTVHIDVQGTSYLGMTPPTRSWVAFDVDPLPANGKLIAVQELCGVKSLGFTVNIDPHEDVKTPVTLHEPLSECARVVKVSNAHPNAYLQVWATNKQNIAAPISDFVLATEKDVTLHVTPYLRRDDQITVRQWACSAVWTESKPIKVQPHSALGLPKLVGPIYSGDTSVKVDCVPGAHIEVSVLDDDKGWAFGGVGDAPDVPASVALNRILVTNQRVRARQMLCALMSDWGPDATVIRPLPQIPVLDSPPNGATGVALTPTFSWHDPGANGEGHADKYEFTLLRQSTPVIANIMVNATSFTAPNPLIYETGYTWQVRAHNISGPSNNWASATFTTLKAPPPPPPFLTSYDVTTKTLKGTGFLANHAVHVRISLMGSSVQNSYGQWVPDGRDVFVNFTSDAQGNLTAAINPLLVLPPLFLDDVVGYLTGCAPSETMNISANDERPDPNDTATGTLWSNTLHVTCS
ncbi:hypothetical protein CU048_14490 [Beijerinckiaceae bacterium]|nr:hypothetical protein CU048_14490 [Beijerinckiaceae bacterium]